MPTRFRIAAELQTVFSSGIGTLTVKDVEDHDRRLVSAADFRPHFNQIASFVDVRTIGLSSDDIRAYARSSVFAPSSRRAIVVSKRLDFGLSRMYGRFRDSEGDPHIIVVYDMADAARWVGVDLPDVEAMFALLQSSG